MAQTSFNIQVCKVTASERHNKREKALSYVRPDLSHLNEFYNTLNVHLVAYNEQMKKLVKEKTGRKMQDKSHALYEGIAVIRPDTTIEDIKKLADAMSKRWGFNFVQLAIHKDEGTWKEGVWKSNLHAHMVFDKIDHETGKTIKTTSKDTAEMQDMCAAILGMERGKKSDKKHLSAIDFKIKAQEERAATLAKEVADATLAKERELRRVEVASTLTNSRLADLKDLKEQAAAQTKAIALQSVLGGLAIHAAKVEQKKISEETTEIDRKVKNLRSTLSFEEGRLNYRRKQYEGLTIQISGLQEQKDSLNTDINKQIAECNEKKSEAESLASVVEAARSDLHGLENRKASLSNELLNLAQEKNKRLGEIARLPQDVQRTNSMLWDFIYSIWDGIQEALNVLCKYLYYPHLNVTFDFDETKAINNALKNAQGIEDRKWHGKRMVELAHAIYPGYADDSTRLWEISREVEKVATKENRWFQNQSQRQDQSRGY